MGWRDRDWAKWTDEERRRFYGSSSSSGFTAARRAKWTDEERRPFYGSSSPSGFTAARSYRTGSGQGRLFGPRVGLLPGFFLAVIVSLVVALALGQLPRSHPLIPSLHFTLPSLSSAPPAAENSTISLPHSLPFRSFLTLHGQLAAGEMGTVTVEGAYIRPPWRLLAAVPAANGSYQARIPLNHKGLLHLRVTYPDGQRSVGEVRVR